jgi:hypothetical protein
MVPQIRTIGNEIRLFRVGEIPWHNSCNPETAMKKHLKPKSKKQSKRPAKIERTVALRAKFVPEPSSQSDTESFEKVSTPSTGEPNYNLPQLIRSDIATD